MKLHMHVIKGTEGVLILQVPSTSKVVLYLCTIPTTYFIHHFIYYGTWLPG